MIQETVNAKCEVVFPLERSDDEILHRLGLRD